MSRILSIQSSVAYGHAGNSAAVFPMQRMGADVIPVYTVHFSNHTGYGAWRGPHLSAADVADVITGVDERGALADLDAVLTGYMGAQELGSVILNAVATAQERSPKAIYCCDPVMGDVGRGFFVQPGIPEYFRDHVLPHAQVLTPNHFELDFLSGHQTHTVTEILTAADDLMARGPSTILVTSAVAEGDDPETVSMIAVSKAGAWRVVTPRLAAAFVGSGDFTAATFLVHLLRTGDLATALGSTAAIVHGVLAATVESGASELQLVAAQEELVNPRQHFEVSQIR
ncbi:MAG: pyridoxal kinase PdxY [Propionibacteriaceae bacterium]